MKILLTLFLMISLLVKPTAKPSVECNIKTIFQAMPPIIFYEQTIDGNNQPPIVTRFIHNKLNIFASQFAKCYASSLELIEVFRAIGVLGLFFWLYYIYSVVINKKWIAIVVFLLIPLVPIIIPDPRIIDYSYKVFAMAGLYFFLKKLK